MVVTGVNFLHLATCCAISERNRGRRLNPAVQIVAPNSRERLHETATWHTRSASNGETLKERKKSNQHDGWWFHALVRVSHQIIFSLVLGRGRFSKFLCFGGSIGAFRKSFVSKHGLGISNFRLGEVYRVGRIMFDEHAYYYYTLPF